MSVEATKRRNRKAKTRKPLMEFMKTVTRKDPFWDELEDQCNESLRDFSGQSEARIDDEYERFKSDCEAQEKLAHGEAQNGQVPIAKRVQQNYLKKLRKRERLKKSASKELSVISNNLKGKQRK